MIFSNYSLKEEKGSKLITPYFCKARRIRALRPVESTPHHNGISNSILIANALPITRKVDETAI